MNEVGMLITLIASIMNAIVFLFTKSQLSAFYAIWSLLVGIFVAVAK